MNTVARLGISLVRKRCFKEPVLRRPCVHIWHRCTLPLTQTTRHLSVTCVFREKDEMVQTGCKELDELLIGSVSKSDQELISPITETSSIPYSSPLTSESSSTFPTPTTDYTSPFSSTSVNPYFSEQVDVTNLLEPSLQSLGLCHYWPSGWLQAFLEFLHIDFGLPWWQTIIGATVCLRILVLPLMIAGQKNVANLNNHQPEFQRLQIEAQMCALRGEDQKARFANRALMRFMVANNCHPGKTMMPLVTNGLVMTSMFFGLRGMTNAPVTSLTTGGTAWFTDLVAQDPLFILPVTAAGTIGLMMYMGADGMNLDTVPPLVKKLLYSMPILSLPVMIYFPAALGVYWVTNNLISLVQSTIMRQEAVRTYLKIPKIIHWKKEDLPMTGFQDELKREMAKQKKEQQMKDVEKARDKLLIEEKKLRETKISGRLLEAFNQEDQERLKENAKNRIQPR